jgi:microcystin-dependent protein
MGHGYLTPDDIDPINVLRLVLVSRELNLQAALTGQVGDLALEACWQQFGAKTPQEVADYFLGVWVEYLNLSLAGVILPYVTSDPPVFALPCDGSTYLRADYPALYAVLDSSFIVDPDHFVTPDLRDRVMLGEGSSYAVGDVGGEAEHTLTITEMPSHAHTDAGHTHAEIAAVSAVINGGLEAPAAAAIPTGALTGSGFANIQNTGGDGAHNNLQPYLAVKFCIVAR